MPKTSPGGYTTLPPPSSSTEFHRATRRPWRQFADLSAFTRPYALGETLMFLKPNLSYFRVNYAIIALSILFLSLLYHPVSLIVFAMAFLIWYYLYFSREDGLVVFNRSIDDRAVSIGLAVVTVLVVGFTGVWLNVLVSGVIAGSVVVLHACFRGTEDLYVDEQEAANGGLVSVVGSPIRASGYRQFL